MKQHLLAFVTALVVWVLGNAVVGVYQAKAQGSGVSGATSMPFQECGVQKDYYEDTTDNCILVGNHCEGLCSRKKFTSRRCKWVFDVSSCTELVVRQQYVWQQASCVLHPYTCSCNDDWHDTNLTGWEGYPRCY